MLEFLKKAFGLGSDAQLKPLMKIADQIDALAATHSRVLLVGHSMGTLFCIDEVLRCSDQIAGLFLLVSPTRMLSICSQAATWQSDAPSGTKSIIRIIVNLFLFDIF